MKWLWLLLSLIFQAAFVVLAMIKGWGLEPKSWPWIGAGVLGLGFGKFLAHVAEQEGKHEPEPEE